MGRILAPFGVKGWVKVENYSDSIETLDSRSSWWLGREGGEWREAKLARTERHGNRLVARFEGCDSPEQAVRYRGLEVAVQRDSLPPLGENEFYQADLIGLEVRNVSDERLGTVAGLFSNGAHEVMRVTAWEPAGEQAGERERLLPFIPQVVKEVDVGAGRILVDWGKDW
jgi:16S rRNA processing protein RimM